MASGDFSNPHAADGTLKLSATALMLLILQKVYIYDS